MKLSDVAVEENHFNYRELEDKIKVLIKTKNGLLSGVKWISS